MVINYEYMNTDHLPSPGTVTFPGMEELLLIVKSVAKAALKLMQAVAFSASGTWPLLLRLIMSTKSRGV